MSVADVEQRSSKSWRPSAQPAARSVGTGPACGTRLLTPYYGLWAGAPSCPGSANRTMTFAAAAASITHFSTVTATLRF